MRLIIEFRLNHNKITSDYRSFLLSYLKQLVKETNEDYYEKLYLEEPLSKPFSFAVYMKNFTPSNKEITIENNFIRMYISSNDYELLMIFYKALLTGQKREKAVNIKPDNQIKIRKLSLEYLDKIEDEEIKVKMLSPLLVRIHNHKSNKDKYLTANDESFEKELNNNINRMLKYFNKSDDTFKITPFEVNKIVIPTMGINFDGSMGNFYLKGKKETLNFLYAIGIGSRRNSGFGLFEVDSTLFKYIKNQKEIFNIALKEIQNSKKLTHWMWYMFPQIHSLGMSQLSKMYEFKDLLEVVDYLNNDYLYNNMYNICSELLSKDLDDPTIIFGNIDSMKLKSSMTLFDYVVNNLSHKLIKKRHNVFKEVLEKYYNSERDLNTLKIIKL